MSFSTQFARHFATDQKQRFFRRDTEEEKDYNSKKTSRCLYLRSTLCLFIKSNSWMTLLCCLFLTVSMFSLPHQPQPCFDVTRRHLERANWKRNFTLGIQITASRRGFCSTNRQCLMANPVWRVVDFTKGRKKVDRRWCGKAVNKIVNWCHFASDIRQSRAWKSGTSRNEDSVLVVVLFLEPHSAERDACARELEGFFLQIVDLLNMKSTKWDV